ncbi:testis-expressed protein 44 [Ctenodactylus gundi]
MVPHGQASLGKEADNRPAEGSAGWPQSQGPRPGDPAAGGATVTPAGQQDVDHSLRTAESSSGDKDKKGAAPDEIQEEPEEATSLLPQDPGAPQVSTGLQNPVGDRLPEDTQITQSPKALPSNSQGQEETPQKARGTELVPFTPNAGHQPAPNVKAQPSVGTSNVSNAEAGGQLNPQPTKVTEAAEERTEDQKASGPASQALPSDGSHVVAGEDLVHSSREQQTQSFPPSSADGMAPSPSPSEVATGWRLLDSSLYMANEENDYMRSVTSLLGGGESAISSLADILVWSDSTMGMGMAVGLLSSNNASPADLLRSEGPSLHPIPTILGSTSSAFSSGLTTGTSSALHSVVHMLEVIERRTVEGIRSAVRYLTGHLTPHWAPTGSDN